MNLKDILKQTIFHYILIFLYKTVSICLRYFYILVSEKNYDKEVFMFNPDSTVELTVLCKLKPKTNKCSY
jgi:hypothetical protein